MSLGDEDESGRFTILVVCTGNICRSPAAERLLAAAYAGCGAVRVVSAGTGAVVGSPMADQMAALLKARGVDASDFAARQLTGAMVRDADLVLGMTREHRGAAARLHPAAVARCFTLVEAARIASTLPLRTAHGQILVDRMSVFVDGLAERRIAAKNATDDDIRDPFGLSDAVYREVFAQVVDCVRSLVAHLR